MADGLQPTEAPTTGAKIHFVAGPSAPASPGYNLFTNIRRLREIIIAERPDIIELGSHLLAPWVLRRALRGLDIPVVGFLHTDVRGYYIEHGLRRTTDNGRRAAEGVLRWYLRKAFDRCATVIAPSEYARGILTWAGIENTVVVPHGIEKGERGKGKRERLGPDGCPVALYAGRLSQEKGLDTVLRALPQLHADVSLHVVMVGEGHLRPELEAYAGVHPELLTVLPYQRDREVLARLYRSVDAVLAPCPYETFGLSAVEAMAAGTAVVGANAGAIAELIGQTGGGIVFEPGNPHALAQAVVHCLARSDEIGDIARNEVRNRFQVDQTMPRLVNVYRDVALN